MELYKVKYFYTDPIEFSAPIEQQINVWLFKNPNIKPISICPGLMRDGEYPTRSLYILYKEKV